MKVLVMGAGVVGTAAAWFLAEAGHEVTVLDRQPGAGLETSFANGGQISASHVEPWAGPRTPFQALKWLGDPDAPLVFRWARWDPALWLWLMRFLRNCTPARASLNTERALRIALYSRARLKALRAETGLAYDERTLGILQVFHDERDFDEGRRLAAEVAANGLANAVLERDAALALEPALTHSTDPLLGGIHFPEDESGDAHLFTTRLAALAAERRGVDFRYGVTVQAIEQNAGRITGLRTDAGLFTADAYVLALGSYSPLLARDLGLRLPVYPAKGYSVTIPVQEAASAGNAPGAPTVSVTDGAYKMVYSRLGDRLRAAGTAELAGWDPQMRERRAETILRNARRLFPRAGDYDAAEKWCGLRPKTPDSVPIIGRTRFPNLFLNTGHGVLGWTMSVGSGRIIADLVSGKEPEVDVRGLGLERF